MRKGAKALTDENDVRCWHLAEHLRLWSKVWSSAVNGHKVLQRRTGITVTEAHAGRCDG